MKSYLEELERTKQDRTEQVRVGLDLYIDLWEKAIERGVISLTDSVDDALAKMEEVGGLYKAAED